MTTEFARQDLAQNSGTAAEPDRVRVIREGVASYLPDIDPDETTEWLESFDQLLERQGPARARYLMLRLLERAGEQRVAIPSLTSTDYVNTIPTELEPWFPGDEEIERRYRAWIRWNAAIMVHRAQRPGVGVGGHISTYASSAALYEVGFNHFFRGKSHAGGGDQVYIQGHASPGIYARAFLEGRLTADQLDGFRQEHSHPGGGIPSYPHPRLMPDFWEFPTVSMGLGPMNAIFQARFNHYLHDRGIKDTSDQHVWAFLGDGEMDEPESRGLIQVAANEALDNLTFVINCNLQRLDGPVRGNGKIIQELESFFRGAGWNVIKVVWGREWDALLHADRDGALVNLMNTTPDGDYQTYKANDGAYVRDHFFGRDPRTKALVDKMSDTEIWNLKRGGHDYRKVYAAYRAATEHKGQPTVILAKTIKGYSLGAHFQGRNATHQMKKLALEDLKQFRDAIRIPISDEELEKNPYLPPYYHPGPDAPEIRYMLDRRRTLGGFVPERRTKSKVLTLPARDIYKALKKGSGNQEVATTMAMVRTFKELLRDKEIGPRIVPIIPDEARTFGMDSWFPSLKIYNRNGQLYTAVDAELMLAYKESEIGQILHEGINEAGSTASFTAAGTSVCHPQRADDPALHLLFDVRLPAHRRRALGGRRPDGPRLRARRHGGPHHAGRRGTAARRRPLAAAGRHQSGRGGLRPGVRLRDRLHRRKRAGPHVRRGPGERLLLHHDLQRALQAARRTGGTRRRGAAARHLPLPARPRAEVQAGAHPGVGGGDALGAQGRRAARRRMGRGCRRLVGDQLGRAQPRWRGDREGEAAPPRPSGARALHQPGPRRHPRPAVAVSDWMRAVPEQIRPWVPNTYVTLGTDGFGFSDTRPAARRYYNTDAESVVVAVLEALATDGEIDQSVAVEAANKYEIDDVLAAPEQTSDPGVA